MKPRELTTRQTLAVVGGVIKAELRQRDQRIVREHIEAVRHRAKHVVKDAITSSRINALEMKLITANAKVDALQAQVNELAGIDTSPKPPRERKIQIANRGPRYV